MIPLSDIYGDWTAKGVLLAVAITHAIWSRWADSNGNKLINNAGCLALLLARVCLVLLLADALVGMLVLPAQYFDEVLATSGLTSLGWELYNVPVYSNDSGQVSAVLSVGVYEPRAIEPDRTVVFFCPNGVRFERLANGFLEGYASDIDARMVSFNFRGVGGSSGAPRKSQDLVDDAVAVVRFVVEKYDTDPSKVILHGWSLGGAIALLSRKVYPSAVVVNDRSFDSLSHAALSIFSGSGAKLTFGILFGVALAFCSSWRMSRMLNRAKYLCMLTILLFFLSPMAEFYPRVLRLFDWEIVANDPGVLYSGPLCVLFHQWDGIIDYQTAAIHPMVNDTLRNDVFTFNLTESTGAREHSTAAHMYILRSVPHLWKPLLRTCVLPALYSSDFELTADSHHANQDVR